MHTHTIIPLKSIDGFELGSSWQEVENKLPKNDYILEKHEITWIVEWKYYKLWFDLPELLMTQIAVYQGYEGGFMNIRLGDTLYEVTQKVGKWVEYGFSYILPAYQGIAFELADNSMDEEWIESEAPISAIYVFLPKKEDNESVL